MAVLAGVCRRVDIVAEGGSGHALELEHDILGFKALVALGAVAAGGEDVLAVVAGTA